MTAVTLQILDPITFSGSADSFRSAVGGCWTSVSTSLGSTLVFEELDISSPTTGYFDVLASRADNSSYVEVVDPTAMIPNKKFPVRVYGNNDEVKSDVFWKTLFIGGTFGDYTYPAIYNEKLFETHYSQLEVPYSKLSASLLSPLGVDQMEITYDYNRYLSEYQNYTNMVSSELEIPNLYILADMSAYSFDEAIELYDTRLFNAVTCEGNYTTIQDLFDVNSHALPADNDFEIGELRRADTFGDYIHLNTSYLTSSISQFPLSSSTSRWMQSKFKNVLMDSHAIETLYDNREITPMQSYFPYCTKIKMPLGPFSDFSTSIIEHDFSAKFIKTLYEVFSEKVDTMIPLTSSFAFNRSYLSGNFDKSSPSEVNTTTTTNVKSIDYIPFLVHCRDNYSSSAPECIFIGENNVPRNSAAKGGNGSYRYFNTVSSINVLHDTINYLSNSANFDITSLSDIYGNNQGHVETLAYRVEKIGGPPTGDARTQDALQNYWFMNSERELINFWDTQVKYDTQYTYNIYSYLLVVGYKYRTTDLCLTKDLGCGGLSDDQFGLEFYDPYSDDEERTEQLYQEGTLLTLFNSLADESHALSSPYGYLADFYLNYEPSIKILEIPLFSKSFKITDYIPNQLTTSPYQVLDSSQTIGYKLRDGAFDTKATYPTPITEKDSDFKTNYLNANDLWEWSSLPKQTVSEPRYIEIYRLSEKPTAISDFDNNLIDTLDLIETDSKYPYTVEFFENRIKTNHKYYYLFRVLNEQYVPGHLSIIY